MPLKYWDNSLDEIISQKTAKYLLRQWLAVLEKISANGKPLLIYLNNSKSLQLC